MKTFMLNEDHKIEVEKTEIGFSVSFYEYYKSANKWVKLMSPINYSKDALEYQFDIEI